MLLAAPALETWEEVEEVEFLAAEDEATADEAAVEVLLETLDEVTLAAEDEPMSIPLIASDDAAADEDGAADEAAADDSAADEAAGEEASAAAVERSPTLEDSVSEEEEAKEVWELTVLPSTT